MARVADSYNDVGVGCQRLLDLRDVGGLRFGRVRDLSDDRAAALLEGCAEGVAEPLTVRAVFVEGGRRFEAVAVDDLPAGEHRRYDAL